MASLQAQKWLITCQENAVCVVHLTLFPSTTNRQFFITLLSSWTTQLDTALTSTHIGKNVSFGGDFFDIVLIAELNLCCNLSMLVLTHVWCVQISLIQIQWSANNAAYRELCIVLCLSVVRRLHSDWQSFWFARHLNLSKEACQSAQGHWSRTPCVILKECIDNRPQKGSAGYSQAFEDFVQDFIITDASQEKRCRIAREGKSSSGTTLHLLFVAFFYSTVCSRLQSLALTLDYPHDIEIWNKFEEYLCVSTFLAFSRHWCDVSSRLLHCWCSCFFHVDAQDLLFDAVDLETKELQMAPDYEKVEYTSIEWDEQCFIAVYSDFILTLCCTLCKYEQDPDLSFDMLPVRHSMSFIPRENGVLFDWCNVVGASHDFVFSLRTLQLRRKTVFLVQCKHKNMPQ